MLYKVPHRYRYGQTYLLEVLEQIGNNDLFEYCFPHWDNI